MQCTQGLLESVLFLPYSVGVKSTYALLALAKVKNKPSIYKCGLMRLESDRTRLCNFGHLQYKKNLTIKLYLKALAS